MKVSEAIQLGTLDISTPLYTFVPNGNGCFDVATFTLGEYESATSLDAADTTELLPSFSANAGDQTQLNLNNGIIPNGYKLLIYKDGFKWSQGVGYNLIVDASTNVVSVEWLFPITNDNVEFELVKI